ncbi:MAG: hypothetical protein JXR70_10840 [Spirochaetales bacterium]|nr:hypothetical protein [Spirochaetales bacterium]
MKLLLISYEEELRKILDFHFSPIGFDLVYYQDPVLVIERIEDFDYDVVIFHAADYPRHWKPLLKLVREHKSKLRTIFILLSDARFDFEEASKAIYLDANGIVTDNINDKRIIFQLEEIFRRYKNLPDNRKFSRFVVDRSDSIDLMFFHPKDKVLIHGQPVDLSIQGMRFKPHNEQRNIVLVPGTEIHECSMRIGRDIINISCLVVDNEKDLGIKFTHFEEGDHQKLFRYLIETPRRYMIKDDKSESNLILLPKYF